MTTEMTLFKDGAVPSYLKGREMDAVTKALMGGGATTKRISIKGGVWRLMSGGKEIAVNEDRAMNVVVVEAAAKVSRAFYEGTYDPDAEKAPSPTCWSADGDRPDKSVETPQGASCADCPKNVKGSGQGESRACRFSRRLAVVLENDLSGDVYQLTLPSQSIFGKTENGKMPLNAYAQYLAGFNVPITAVVTEMRFDTNSATPKLTFKAVRPLTEAEFHQCEAQGKTPAAKSAITMTVAQADGVQKLENKTEAPKVADVVDKQQEAAAPGEEAPKKRESTKAAPPEPKKSLQSVIDQWDD